MQAAITSGKLSSIQSACAATRAQLATAITVTNGKPVSYQNLGEAEFTALLIRVGLPEGLAEVLANSDIGASRCGLFDDGHQLSKVLGRPTTTLEQSLRG